MMRVPQTEGIIKIRFIHSLPEFPDPLDAIHEDRKYSIYCTYTPS